MHSIEKVTSRLMRLGFCFFLVTGSLHSVQNALSYGIEDKEEAFLVRRIAEFWKDQDYQIVKAQIAEFLEKYPKSKINDQLRAILGDLFLQEHAFDDALSIYEDIRSPEICEKTAMNRLQCYYELGQFQELAETGSQFIMAKSPEIELRSEEFHFLMGEAFFRQGINLTDPEKKKELLTKALPFYERALNSSFNDPSMFALAEIYRYREDNRKAAAFFLELSQRHPGQKEDLLFHAGLAQSEFDKSAAIDTFTKIIERGGIKAKDASLNRLILYFQQERFRDVIESSPELVLETSGNNLNTLHYILGRSYFGLDDFVNASLWFDKYISFSSEPSNELRNVILMQLNTAQNLKNREKYQEVLAHLYEYFPADEEIDHATFMHAMLLKEDNEPLRAEERLAHLFYNSPQFEDRETLLLEYGSITFANGNWLKSHEIWTLFLEEFQGSRYENVAYKYLLSNALQLLKEIEAGSGTTYTKQQFHKELKTILAKEGVLNETELKESLFLLGKVAFELENYADALASLTRYNAKYPEDKTSGEIHLLIALCHHKLGENAEQFCLHAKAALEKNPELENRASIHLELYNAYLTLIEKKEEKNAIAKTAEQLDALYSQAAEHLYQAMTIQELPVKLDNQLWLANYYHKKSIQDPKVYQTDGKLPASEDFIFYNRSARIFSNILLTKDSSNLIAIGKENTFLESEAIKLAKFLGREGKFDQKVKLLTELIEQQNKKPSHNWKMKKEAFLELAKTYESLEQKENAFETYKFLKTQLESTPSFISEYAALHTYRLQFDMLRSEEKKEGNIEVVKILNALKEFQIRKNIFSEPLHLEAALEYAWIRAQLADEAFRKERYLFFLGRIVEDFDNLEDPTTMSYHKDLRAEQEKFALFKEYMTFVDLEVSRCELFASANGETKTEKTLQQLQSQYEKFLDTTSSYYLTRRVNKSLSCLNQSKIS